MTAEVQRTGPRRFRAWCDEHKDGINVASRQRAQGWADYHNAKHHPDTRGVTGQHHKEN